MKAKELRGASPNDLRAKIDELRQEYMNLRFQLETKQLENTAAISRVRRDLARVLTVLTEKERLAQGAES
jgi:large subunit ribosomal protein L29